jgi:chromosome segregation protein
MRLRKIKLAGFKSFVDPTTLIVPANLVGIVGPNGCGKSNIIDAVTWVMGESSAKHLRGESLTDVIFNGSSARQPVSQAMVELVFENNEGRLGGQYAAYNEIAIKRQINREGVSSYFLNGTRCRRKDIHGIFLGTGLGPRGYSIIEQGMISRLIEAKPDELRNFIEEAAGISKYREKRRETENRIRHTKENLDRLNDIREELGKQLNHLQRQAKAAERYQLLKQEERQLKAELLALNYRDLRADIAQRDEKVRIQETQVEQCIAQLRTIEAEIEKKREELSGANEAFNKVQSDYYQVGGDISQLEQKIEYSNERILALEADIAKVQQLIVQTEEQHRNDQRNLAELADKVTGLEPKLQGSRSESNKAYDTLNQAEQAMQKWQDEWDAFKETEAGFRQQIEIGNARVMHLEESLEEVRHRRQTLVTELESVDDNELEKQSAGLDAAVTDTAQKLLTSRADLESRQTRVREFRDQLHVLTEKIAAERTHQHKIEGTLSALIPLQQGEQGESSANVHQWLASFGETAPAKLLEQINVEPEWAHALETVLGQNLQSVVVNNFADALNALTTLTEGNVNIITKGIASGETNSPGLPRMLDKVVSGTSLDYLLGHVYLADDIANALAVYDRLGQTESIVTRSGIWIGKGWIRVNHNKAEDSVLLREKKIQTLRAENETLLSAISTLQQQLESARTGLEQAETEQQQAQKYLGELQEQYASLQSQHAEIRTRREQILKRSEQIEEELETLGSREESARDELDSLQNMLGRTSLDQTELSTQKAQLVALREKHQGLLDGARSSWQTTHEHSHEIALQLESLSSQRASLEQAIRRNEIQIGNLGGNLAELHKSLVHIREPLEALREKLAVKLSVRLEIETQLNSAREFVQTIDRAIREQEQGRGSAEQSVEENRAVLEKLKMDSQEFKVRLQTVMEQLQEGNHEPEPILENLDEQANKQAWQEKIQSTEQKIQRLGPINLAAIDEFNQLTERKEYLDRQNADLTEALNTLETAIRKIDKETRTRFQETFDKLNTNLKEMFPILFGGGHAYLEMTGNDLLETGIAITARPPGKKNSSIHLLSGGEKALTAVALVFAIFKLNPAPFCILDEVDAPLDDTNAGRFSQLLAEMSSEVQFLFITHNKITMEIANQLLGVTMYEPGVSRLVTVDVEEAVKMVATA